ncbi:MAG: hypothetical protein C5B56_01540 [Proteobacteria bacterium]|nr:MAG: hypothetical protein C5B56_01540 [Pseudomonadota bacterium]
MKFPNTEYRTLSASLSTAAVLILICAAAGSGKKPDAAVAAAGDPVLWRAPGDIESRDLYLGPGGQANQPPGTFRFVDEDLSGTTPKFDVVDSDGTMWMAKLGIEARPETVASRLLWAVGYFSDETYFVPALHVENMPSLQRGGKVVKSDGAVHNVRIRRRIPAETRIGIWSWQKCPFAGSREWYGLRVLMAVINNWDLKDDNNSIYQVSGPHPEQHYLVADLGASFGSTGLNLRAKGKVEQYSRSKWINGVSGDYVDFNVPSGPTFGFYFDPPELSRRLGLRWLGRHIPVADARWMGSLLGRLSPEQIRGAFRAGGYTPGEVEEFSKALEQRIAQLKRL